MGDAFISAISNRLIDEILKTVGNEINLVWGVQKEVHDLATKLMKVTNILDDADKQGFTNKTTKGWLKRLEKACYEMEDVLDEWKYVDRQKHIVAQNKVCCIIPSPSSCLSFNKVSSHHHIAKKVEQVKKQLGEILEEKDQYDFLPNQPIDKSWRVPSTSFVKKVDILGRDIQKEKLLNTILDDQHVNGEQSSIQVISLVGSGGVGKTALAQLVYNDDSGVLNSYPLKMWMCVSNPLDAETNPFDTTTIARGILIKVLKFKTKQSEKDLEKEIPRQEDLEYFLGYLKDSIQGQKFLLILDDVWNVESSKWEPLKTCLEYGDVGSKIVVTTRKEDVAKNMGSTRENDIHQIKELSNEDCWLILSRIALPNLSEIDREKFKKTGMEIAVKCKGLPLAAKTMGSLLLQKDAKLDEWDNIAKSEMWELEKVEIELFPHLALSYNELPLALKRCFSYCSFFPKDHIIDVDDLIRNWMAQGYLGSQGESLERKGREYFNTLAKYSLFQEFRMDEFDATVIVKCKMHDIIHDFAKFLRSNKSNGIIVHGATCKNCNRSLVSQVEEYRSLFCWHEPLLGICDCLANVRALYSKYIFPRGLGNLIQLRSLYLKDFDGLSAKKLKIICKLYNLETLVLRDNHIKEIPEEIGELIGLRHLDLSGNVDMKTMPKSICNLHQLQSLNMVFCPAISGLPKGFHNLNNFKHLYVDDYTQFVGVKFPDEVIGQLTGLHTLTWFQGRLSYLRNMDQLRGSLTLEIPEDMSVEENVVKAKGAELNKKELLKHLKIIFSKNDTNVGDLTPVEMDIRVKNAEDVLDDLKPHKNLCHLEILFFQGSKLSNWIYMPFNHLKSLLISGCLYLTSLPPLGKLPCLENLRVYGLGGLKFLRREFLGITTPSASVGSSPSSSSSSVAFPKLKTLLFKDCESWEEWEDIKNEEEASATLSLFPCLHELTIDKCANIRVLPYGLLRKAPALRDVYLLQTGIQKDDVEQCCGNSSDINANWRRWLETEQLSHYTFQRSNHLLHQIRMDFL